jgi:hypothetical protein
MVLIRTDETNRVSGGSDEAVDILVLCRENVRELHSVFRALAFRDVSR